MSQLYTVIHKTLSGGTKHSPVREFFPGQKKLFSQSEKIFFPVREIWRPQFRQECVPAFQRSNGFLCHFIIKTYIFFAISTLQSKKTTTSTSKTNGLTLENHDFASEKRGFCPQNQGLKTSKSKDKPPKNEG